MNKDIWTGAGSLIRLFLRKDRLILPVWVIVLALLPLGYGSSIAELYPSEEMRARFVGTIASNPAMAAFYGPVFGSSVGALAAWRSSLNLIFVALASALTVIRHTRTDEEAGRRELLGATAVGHHAGLTAALIVVFSADLAVGLLMAAGLIGTGLPAAGSLALGLSMAAAGWVFAAAAGVAAQLSEGAGTARSMTVTALGLVFALRAVGDVGESGGMGWLTWLSPIGWMQRVRPYADERWWPFALALGAVAVLTAAAYRLSARRDIGAGIVPPRPGPAAAGPGFRSPLALAWRLQRGALYGWSAGFAALGLALGGVAKSAADGLAESPQLIDILEKLGGSSGLADTYFAATMNILALAVSAYAIQAVLRLRTEETEGRAEPLLATSVGRLRWAAGHLLFALAGPAAALAAGGLAAGLAYGLSAGDVGRELPRVLAGALVQLPAVYVPAGIALLLFGLLPRLAALSWAMLAAFLLLGQLGALLGLPDWALDLSPFTHIPRLPGGDVSFPPLLWMLLLSAALAAAGLSGWRRRDLRP
ncbi:MULTISPECIES: ABC transporter permease [Cohnella]|uniref:ABC transporter permease n=1 Tax=Cohnella TaxID=329857 RepID=UPI000E386C12|nr:ABC transporter permease [Cohnella sp.]REK66607.1 MAG: ABC transporter permease [Cohnella sp.]